MMDWNLLAARMQRNFGWLRGLRVCELHKSHGIHFHALVNGRIPVDRMRRLIYGSGHLTGHNRYLDFGRIHVRPCVPSDAEYLSKYMTKQYTKDHWFGLRRRWGTIGGFRQVKKNDIEIISPSTQNRKLLFGEAQVPYATLMATVMFTNWFGELKNWPRQYLRHLIEQTSARSNWMKHYENLQAGLFKNVADDKEAEDFARWLSKDTGVVADTGASRGRDEGAMVKPEWDGETGFEPDYANCFFGQPF